MIEEDRKIISYAKRDTGPFSSYDGVNKLLTIIDRFVKENEELQTQLDAIKKVWEPVKPFIASIDKWQLKDWHKISDMGITYGHIRHIDKLIGGGK